MLALYLYDHGSAPINWIANKLQSTWFLLALELPCIIKILLEKNQNFLNCIVSLKLWRQKFTAYEMRHALIFSSIF